MHGLADEYDSQLTVQGTGDPVLLVPGIDGTGQLFYRQVSLLARSYRVGTYALRDVPSMEVLVADLARVIDTMAPVERRAIVIGESFGGALALSLALEQPDRVSALVVMNSFPYFAPQLRLHLAMYGLRVLPWGAMGLIRRLTAFRLHSAHTHRQDVRRFMELTRQASRDGYLARLEALTQYDVRQRLHDIRVPTLFLAADQDHLVPAVEQARYMAARVPGSVVRILAGHGHICAIAPDVDFEQILHEWAPGS